jgi:hypothetical protein
LIICIIKNIAFSKTDFKLSGWSTDVFIWSKPGEFKALFIYVKHFLLYQQDACRKFAILKIILLLMEAEGRRLDVLIFILNHPAS